MIRCKRWKRLDEDAPLVIGASALVLIICQSVLCFIAVSLEVPHFSPRQYLIVALQGDLWKVVCSLVIVSSGMYMASIDQVET